MKQFKYELQEVLEFRQFEQEQAEAELGKALAVETEINNNLELLAQQFIASKESVKNSKNFEDVVSLNRYKELLDYQKEELLNQLAQAKLVTEEKRKILTECMKKTSALDKLKEQQFEEYKKDVAKKEKSFIDELGSQGYFKQNFKD
ncbi:MAG: flagellar export protein FliJ [Treponema sp.]|nr:flagellar export protein FliJ [Treponema sp.]